MIELTERSDVDPLCPQRDDGGSMFMAEGYSLLGQTDEALEWAENQVRLGDINYPALSQYDPFLDNVRGDPRFQRLMTQVKSFPAYVDSPRTPRLLVGEVVIASDALKRVLARFRYLVGGEIRGFQVLQTRARREAVLRVLEQAQQVGFNAVCNLRLESVDIGGNTGRRQQRRVMVTIVASGTAYDASSP